MARLLEEGEIDDWLREEKERLEERMLQEAERGVELDRAAARFHAAFKPLLQEYERRFLAAARSNERRARLRRPFQRFRIWREERLLRVKLLWKGLVERYDAWRRERAYRRLFRMRKSRM